jgi:hypothetical protein
VLSYSWYLWHWPLTELMRTLPIGQDSVWKDVASSSMALLISIPTYLLVERPMKTLRRREITSIYGGRIVAVGLAGSVLIALLALVLARSSVFERGLQAIPPAVSYQQATECRPATNLPKFSNVQPCVVGSPGEPRVMVMGDSHSLVLRPIADWAGKAENKAAVVLGLTTCPPLQGVDVAYFSRSVCARSNNEILAWLKTPQNPITGAVLTARWSFYNEQDTPAGEAVLPSLFWRDAKGRGSRFPEIAGEGLADFVATLGGTRRVLIVGPVPELKAPIENCLQRAQLTGQPRESCAVRRADVERRHSETWQVLRGVAAKFSNVRLIDPAEALCDRDTCWPFGPRGLYYVDKDHLSVLGTELLYARFEQEFRWVYGDGPAK